MGMWPSVEMRFLTKLYLVLQLRPPTACAWARVWGWAMLIALMIAILPWQTVAETPSSAPSHTTEQVPGSLRRGTVTLISNLRSSPSMHGEIVAVAKEGARVLILQESGRWLQVRDEEGVEAWIYKPLVLIEQERARSLSGTPMAMKPSDRTNIASAVAATPDVLVESPVAPAFPDVLVESPVAPAFPDVLVESPAETILEGPESAAPSSVPIGDVHVLPRMTWPVWDSDTWLSHLQGRAAYVIIALIIVLVLAIGLQLRAARQLRRATQEVGQIFDIVEEIYAGSLMARTSNGAAMVAPMTAEKELDQQTPPPGIEFSPAESMLLEALSDQSEVQEAELGKILDEKGFAGVLIKAIIGDIVRKTGIIGLPWVEVHYVQGRYRYRLRPEAVPNLSVQRLEKR